MSTVQELYLRTIVTDEVVDNIVPLTANDRYPIEFPGYVGISGDSIGTVDAIEPVDQPSPDTREYIDRISYGERGLVNWNTTGEYGPVEPEQVCNHQMTGQVARIPSISLSSPGVVGQSDQNALTAIQVAMQMAGEAYSDTALLDLLNSGV